jgi:hypothetical protein
MRRGGNDFKRVVHFGPMKNGRLFEAVTASAGWPTTGPPTLDARGRSPHVRSSCQPHCRRGSRGSLPRVPLRRQQTAVLVIDLCPSQGLDGPGVVTFIREGVAAGVAEHVMMRLDLEAGCAGRPLDRPSRPS